MFEDFLDGKCNIYHVEDATPKPAYGIETKSIKAPGKTAVLTEVPCHFHIKTNSLRIVQNEPHSSVDGEEKLTLPFGTDIRKNDIVEDCSTGLKYRAGLPRAIHNNHHMIVTLMEEGGIKTAL